MCPVFEVPAINLNQLNTHQVRIFENHHEAYYFWREKQIKNKILVHIDAHIDFNWIDDERPDQLFSHQNWKTIEAALRKNRNWNISCFKQEELITIGNYINPAIREGLIKEFYWVVPEPVWKDFKQKRRLKNILLALKKKNPESIGTIKCSQNRIESSLLGIKTIILPLSEVPVLEEEVLLDIDVDFMLIDSITDRQPYFTKQKLVPWIWPLALVDILKAKKIKPFLTTIAYSVEGGFIPLKYKWLGNELYAILTDKPNSRLFDTIRGIVDMPIDQAIDTLLHFLKSSSCCDKDKASVFYWLYTLYREKKEFHCASFALKEAIALDLSYKSVYNNKSLFLQREKKFNEAVQEAVFFLSLFPDEEAHRMRLGHILLNADNPEEALLQYQQVIQKNPQNHEALSLCGYIYLRKRNNQKALEYLQAALAINDKDLFSHYWLGLVYIRQKAFVTAIASLQRATLLGLKNRSVYSCLAFCYLRQGNFLKVKEKSLLAVKAFFLKQHIPEKWQI